MWWRRATTILAPWLWFLVRDASPLLELVAVTLPLLVLATAVPLAGLALRRRWLAAPAASIALVGVIAVVGPWIPHGTGHPVADASTTIAVANVLARNTSPEAVVRDILGQDADVVVVPEATPAVDALLREEYEYALRPDAIYTAELGVYGRVPIDDTPFVSGLLDLGRQRRVLVRGPSGDFVLWALHLPKPWLFGNGDFEMRPPGHARKLDAFLDAFARDAEGDLPVVVAGDTNLTDRGRGYRKLTARFDDAMRGTWGGPTARKWYLRPLLLRVDHVLIPPSWCADQARRFALAGSDHRGVAVRIGACRD